MRIRSLDIIGLSFVTFAALCTSAQATIVDAPTVVPQASTIFTQVYTGNTPVSSFTGNSTETTGGVSATATGAFQPSPNETTSASVVGAGAASSAYSIVEYYFGVNSISPVPDGTTVDIVVTASGSVTQTLSTTNSAQLYFGTPTSDSLLTSACTASGGNSCSANGLANRSSFSIATPETLKVGYQYSLTLDLYVSANTGFGASSDAQSGIIDPIISFALPSDAALYNLVLSPETGNSPIAAVPEPSTWAMMILGFAGIGFMTYRRRNQSAALTVA
jgi:hypothetical protein